MKKLHLLTLLILALLFFGCNNNGEAGKEGHVKKETVTNTVVADPLPSWNDGPLKQALFDYVKKITDSGTPGFIPTEDRIATFDNDGTLWAEKPLVQELFAFYRVKEMVAKDPSLAKKQPFKAVLENDKSYFEKGGMKAIVDLVNATHTGMTVREFETSVRNFFANATYPRWNVPIRKIVYQPQLELLNYLRANDFKIYICSGGTVEFIRGISRELYDIPREQVIGSLFKYKFVDSNTSIIREAGLAHFNDKEGKPAAIQAVIGHPPVFACGNEGGKGDIAMLQFSQSSQQPSFQMIINHDDSVREFYYQEKDNGTLIAAAKNNWHVVSMKNDWKTIFPGK